MNGRFNPGAYVDWLLHPFRNFACDDREYFSGDRPEITRRNAAMVVKGCTLYAAVLVFYTVFTTVTSEPQILRNMYYVFDIVHLGLCASVYFHGRRNRRNFATVQAYSIALETSILLFFALEGALYSKTEPSLYIPIAILLILLLFIHSVRYTVATIVIYLSVFVLLSRLNKTPAAYTADILIALATLIASCIGYVLVADMRHNEGAAMRKYEKLSRTDPLTGFLNKAAFRALSDRIISRPESRCAFVIIDLDDFKYVNDHYGHGVGDEVLVAVAGALRGNFRQSDYLGRFGGDEFIVLMNQCESAEAAAARVDGALNAVGALRFSRMGLAIHCSAGVAIKKPNDTSEDLFTKADDALYRAKRAGKGRSVVTE